MGRVRIALLISGVFFAYFALVLNIYNLQLKKGQYFADRAEAQYQRAGFLEPKRGNIYFTDKNKNLIPAAINKSYPVIFAVPKKIKNPESDAKIISDILGLNEEAVKKSFTKPDDEYELLVAKANSEQVAKIKESGIKGIYVDSEDFRFYPFENLAAHLLGFVSPSDSGDKIEGRYGLEAYFEEDLAGISGKMDAENLIDPINGKDLVLTIDRNIQGRAEEILKNLIEKYGAEGGTVIVNEPRTGKILALGNYQSFDPNNYKEYKVGLFLNPAVQALYEPGSVFKVITMAAGIDSGKITPETKYYDSGSVIYNGYTIKNWDLKAHGWITMTETIEQSINTGAAFAERQTGHGNFYDYLLNFGFSDKTDISLPGELFGNLRNLTGSIRDINFATAAFGQGVSVTPIRLISAISAIANSGNLMRPYLLASAQPKIVRRVISEDAARQVSEMMVSAVNKAVIAHIDGYNIAGKTGTAQVPDLINGGYTNQVINTYVGFAPAYNPKFTILFKLNKPKGAPLAGLTVVPAFREMAEFIINYYNIPPDNLKDESR